MLDTFAQENVPQFKYPGTAAALNAKNQDLIEHISTPLNKNQNKLCRDETLFIFPA